MVKKYFLNSVVFVLFAFQMQAQSMFSIKITQVYPTGGVVYGNTYDLSSELEAAEKKLRSQYTGKDANYVMELTRPSGKETKTIQNINWILVKNGVKENYKGKPVILNDSSYPEATKIQFYACNNDGSKRGESVSIDYDHYYEFYIDGKKQPITGFPKSYYRPLVECERKAKEYLKDKGDESLPCEVRIFNDRTKEPVDIIDNEIDYKAYKDREEKLRIKKEGNEKKNTQGNKDTNSSVFCKDSLRILDKQLQAKVDNNYKSKIKIQAFAVAINCIDVGSSYSWKGIDDNLNDCQQAIDKYWVEKQKINIGLIEGKLNEIKAIMNTKLPVPCEKKNLSKKGSVEDEIKKLRILNNTLK